MRGLKSTIALLVVLVGLGAYIYFVASKTDDTASKNERLFPGVVSDNVEELTVKSESGDVTTVKKQDNKWSITSPISSRGSDLDASGITSGLSGLEVTRVVEDNPADLKDYGLDAPRIEVTFKSNNGKPSGKLLIGKKTSTGGSLYARKDGDKRVVLIGEYNDSTFNKTTFDLRDKAIMAFDRSKVDSFDVALDNAKSTFEVDKKGQDWMLVKPIAARADNSASDGLVNSAESLQMKSVVSTSPTADDLKKYGLDKPASLVNLHLGSARASLAIGGAASDDTYYARDMSKPDVYTVQKTAGDDFRKTVDDYRRKDMFDMRAFTATHIEITRNGKTVAFDKVKGSGENPVDTWKRVAPAGSDPDKDKFQTFVAGLADIRATSFVDSKAKTGLDNPAMTVVVKFDDGKKEDRVTFAKNGSDAYAARPDDPGAAKIDASKLDDAVKSVDEFTK
jgi:Domain of unknown function (DUF4340)